MKSVSGKDFARIVERCGWRLMRIAGSHHIYGKDGSVVRLSFRFTAIGRSRQACFAI